ncbi:MAG: hypothetical protein GY714_18255 [Desulfobacterales bacterium]|nr:hypothetical protein [Desulfobacterales bacterium]
MDNIKKIGVKLTRAERRGRKIIIVIEPDLFSSEVFGVTPFYDEGDEKNQLQNAQFVVNITEEDYKVDANVSYTGCHYTKGHTQLHSLSECALSKKDVALNWFLTEEEKYYTEDRIQQILKLWVEDEEFYKKLVEISTRRKKEFKILEFNKIKERYEIALGEFDKALKAF